MITVMVYIVLFVLGLCLGSFVNALVWRMHEQEVLVEAKPKNLAKQLRKLSITRGRSMCTHCEHELAPKDLVPVASWVCLRGKCRYCKKPIQDTPIPELILPVVYVISYMYWPLGDLTGTVGQWLLFAVWGAILLVYLALALYDARWQVLPNVLVGIATVLAVVFVIMQAVVTHDISSLWASLIAALGLFGLLYALFAVSNERWIGGGDVKLAVSLGLLAGSVWGAMLTLFFASLAGTFVALPSLLRGKASMSAKLPFGPYLMAAVIVVFLWGQSIADWYFGILL